MNDKYLVVDMNVISAQAVADFLNKFYRDGWVLLEIIPTDEYRRWPQAVFEKRLLENVFPTATIPPGNDNITPRLLNKNIAREFKVNKDAYQDAFFSGMN